MIICLRVICVSLLRMFSAQKTPVIIQALITCIASEIYIAFYAVASVAYSSFVHTKGKIPYLNVSIEVPLVQQSFVNTYHLLLSCSVSNNSHAIHVRSSHIELTIILLCPPAIAVSYQVLSCYGQKLITTGSPMTK